MPYRGIVSNIHYSCTQPIRVYLSVSSKLPALKRSYNPGIENKNINKKLFATHGLRFLIPTIYTQ